MASAVERFDEKARASVGSYGRTVIHEGEVLRHRVYTRVVHWLVAISFFLSLFTGFAIYTPWLYRWFTPLFGGGAMTRLLHPWFGLAFVVVFTFQILNWLERMRWTPNDSRWMKRLKAYATNEEKVEGDDVGFFNAGQKLYFWTIAITAIVFLVTGIAMWFPHTFGRTLAAISYVLHDIAALIMLGGIFIHLYESTFGIPGTFRGMIRGVVSDAWAWTHHPGWYREATGRDARQDREAAAQRMKQR